MKLRIGCVVVGFLMVMTSLEFTVAQTSSQTVSAAASALPRLVRFGGSVKDLNGRALTGVVGITFALYSEQSGGAPLWLETQNVSADSNGHYTALLGSTKPDGLPAELFTSEQARWVGVQVSGQTEQPRVLLVSAPYALKAGDAETIGGFPPSAFVLAGPVAMGSATPSSTAATVPPPAGTDVTTTGGTADFLPIFNGAATIVDSAVFQTGSGTTAKVGINTTTPASALDVKGGATVRGTISLPAVGTASATAGKNSQALTLAASAFNGATGVATNQVFRWQAEPAGNDTAAPSGTLKLLFGEGAATPAETGLYIASNGQITFAAGQTFPGGGGGSGTVTSVATGLGLEGGPITSSGTLKINPAVVPQLAAANIFTANQIINGTGGVGSYGLTVNQPTQTGILVEGPITGAGAGLDLKTVGTGGKQWEILATGNTASQGTGKLNIRDVNSSTDVLTIDASDAVNVNTNLKVSGGSITLTGNQTVNGTVEATSTASAVIGNSTSTIFAAVSGGGPAIGVFGNASGASGSGVYGSGATGVVGVSTGTGPGGSFTGWTAPAGSGLKGMDGASTTGGNSDPNSGTDGGDGLVVAGGASGYTSTASGEAGAGISAVAGLGRIIYVGEGVSGELGVGGSFTGGANLGVLYGGAGGDGIDAQAGLNQGTSEPDGYAGNFTGDLNVSGAISAGTKDFKIDYPLDPANKYLVHASVESSEMKNMYDGTITTDGRGQATVQLPEWFEVLNTDFRYQLTVIGQFAQAIIGHKIENNRFEIRTSAPNVEVSWQVTGVRQDAYAKAHPLVVEQEKDARLRGFYIHPELYGAPAEKQIEWARHPQMMKKIQAMQARQLAAAQKQAVPRN